MQEQQQLRKPTAIDSARYMIMMMAETRVMCMSARDCSANHKCTF
jgi:hypothetical protein